MKPIPIHPSPVGPFAEACVGGDLVYTSGMAGCDMQTGDPVAGGAGEQAKAALQNLDIVLGHAGTSLKNVVKATLYIRHRADFDAIDQAYKIAMAGHNCARCCVFTSAMVDDRFLLEIEVVATK